MENQSQKRAIIWKDTLYQALNKDYEDPEACLFLRWWCIRRTATSLSTTRFSLVSTFVSTPRVKSMTWFRTFSVWRNSPTENGLDATTAVGFMGIMGNKGGAGIRFNIDSSNVCFVCSHLAAHREKVYNRNADFHRYGKRLINHK